MTTPARMRGELPTLMVSLREDPSAGAVAEWVLHERGRVG